MPSTPGDGRGKQLPLPQRRRVDTYGLCAVDCECARCAIGFRPTPRDRELARWAWEARERKRKEDAAKAAGPKKPDKAKARADAFRADEKYTDTLIAKLSTPVERPATEAELEELRRQYPNLQRRRKPR